MELLAPAGNLDKLKTAILYGADAVYLAGQKFSLRGASENFSYTELVEGLSFAKGKKCKIYVTLNAFLHDKDLGELTEYISILDNLGVDAVIVSDLGVMTLVQKNSKLPIHVSTQASCLNVNSAKLWKNIGAKRLILGREVSVEEASRIREEVDIEIELFVHGSMCMSYSGNCIISNYTAGRDSNRGGCIQSCRFLYSMVPSNAELNKDMIEQPPKPLLSSKDLRGIELLPLLIQSNVDSIKVEGRMKSTLYVATTTSIYSKAINLCKSSSSKGLNNKLKDLSRILEKIPNRGYTEGFLKKVPKAGSIYNGERNDNNSKFEFVGTVMEVEGNKYFTMLVQNSFDRNSTLEILNFDGEVIEISSKEMSTILNTPVLKTSPNRLVRIPLTSKNSNVQKFSDNINIQPLNVVRCKSG